jgi:hypothetical protein
MTFDGQPTFNTIKKSKIRYFVYNYLNVPFTLEVHVLECPFKNHSQGFLGVSLKIKSIPHVLSL